MPGPRSDQTQPIGSVSIPVGSSIQTAINANPNGTTFWLPAGIRTITSAITPKSGNTFVGEFGAILDGSTWSSSDSTQACFRAHNQDIDNVTIRNLVIRNMPQKGIHAFRDFSSGWILEYVEVSGCKDGISLSYGARVRHCYIHHNVGIVGGLPEERGGGYVFNEGDDIIIENCEIAYNGEEQKSINITNIWWRNNFVHHNVGAGIWADGDATGSIIEGNFCEDNGSDGIMWEQCRNGIIRNNYCRRNADRAIFISTSNTTEVYGNTLEDNFRGVIVFINCTAIGSQPWNPDLYNNNIHNNITYTRGAGAYASLFSYVEFSNPACTHPLSDYLNNVKNNLFFNNQYFLESVGAAVFLWNASLNFAQWQALPQDAGSTVSTSYTPSTAIWVEEGAATVITGDGGIVEPTPSIDGTGSTSDSGSILASTFQPFSAALLGSLEGVISSSFSLFSSVSTGDNGSILASTFAPFTVSIDAVNEQDGIINSTFPPFTVSLSGDISIDLFSTFPILVSSINANFGTILSSTFFPLSDALIGNSQIDSVLASTFRILQSDIRVNSELSGSLGTTFAPFTDSLSGSISDSAIASTFKLLTDLIDVSIEDSGILNSTFPPFIVDSNGNIESSNYGAGVYYLKIGQKTDKIYSSISPMIQIDTEIESEIVTHTIHDDEENVLHIGGFSVRALGSGRLHSLLEDLDSIDSQILRDIALQEADEYEPFRLANFKSQRSKLTLYNDQLTSWFDITRIVVYVKKLWTDYSR